MRRVIALVVLISLAFGVVAIGQGSAEQTCSVQAFFASPNVTEIIESELTSLIQSASSTIDVAMYSFTNNLLEQALVYASRQRVKVRVLLDDAQDSPNTKQGQYLNLINASIDVVVENVQGKMHHKFMIIDNAIVITGSYNWSDAAKKNNCENIVVIRCRTIAAVFTAEFTRLWSILQSGGVP